MYTHVTYYSGLMYTHVIYFLGLMNSPMMYYSKLMYAPMENILGFALSPDVVNTHMGWMYSSDKGSMYSLMAIIQY